MEKQIKVNRAIAAFVRRRATYYASRGNICKSAEMERIAEYWDMQCGEVE